MGSPAPCAIPAAGPTKVGRHERGRIVRPPGWRLAADGGGAYIPAAMARNSPDIDKAPGDTRVVVAMSGGVDSSVTAALLAEQGYDVVGITLQLYDHGAAVGRPGACCAGQDIQDARQVA